MSLGDLAAEGESDAGSGGLGGEKGNEEIGGVGDSGTAVEKEDFGIGVGTKPPEADGGIWKRGCPGFEDSVGGVALEVDQELFELIRIRPHDEFGAWE